MLAALVLGRVLALALIACRFAGFVVVSPWPGQHVSPKVRTGFVLALSLSVATWAEPPTGVDIGLSLLPIAMVELCIGLCIGMAFRFVHFAAAFFGDAVSISAGLAVPAVMNPDQGEQQTALTRIFTLCTLLLAISAGVHRLVLEYLLASFTAVPLTTPVDLSASAPIFIELVGESLMVGIQLALPVLAVSLAVQAALGIVARAAPSLQLFSIGFTVMVMAGLATLVVAFRDIAGGFIEHFWSVRGVLEAFFEAIVP